MNELREQIEELHRQMLAAHPALLENLRALEMHLLHERDATVQHIRHIRSIRQQSEAIIRGEWEALREVLIPTQTPPPIPSVEDRYTRPRFLSEVA
jgi:hypothetical protein